MDGTGPASIFDGTIAICASFTAEPVRESLEYWLNELGIAAKLEFAAYNQVIQTLVDPRGLFAQNKSGLNVVLVRLEDGGWEHELVGALKTAAGIAAAPILVCNCPASPHTSHPDHSEEGLASALAELSGIRFLSSERLRELYPVANYYDAAADQLGHMPYTPEAYAALGTAIARVFHASRRAPYKVIVTDCDNTLWRGVCGEKGPEGVAIDEPARALQNFLKRRQTDGMLLCASSKNAAEDVEQTFDAHPEMPLKRSDFTGWRVNWRPKSENIQALARELSLGLDSFIFVDDNPMETAEVEAHCPGVLALTLPADTELIPRFLDHVWAFDQNGVTAEDRKRTRMYRENALRRGGLAGSLSYADFLRSLELTIDIRELNGPAEIERAAQMTQRTNQFNLTTRRLTSAEIREMISGGAMQALAAFVRDRYGDYGQVGLVMYEAAEGVLQVRDFLLSCRVLGKGVEHAMVRKLGEIAVQRLLGSVEIAYVPTAKNTPARDFLTSLGSEGRIPAAAAAAIEFSPAAVVQTESEGVAIAPVSGPAIDYAWIASHRADAASILEAVQSTPGVRAGLSEAEPRDQLEKELTRIWERVLRITPIGIHDNFFDLGGDSLRAVRLVADLKAITERDLSLAVLVEAPTIAALAQVLRTGESEPRWIYLVPIKSTGSRPPFFCVHGVGGNVLEYMDLARHMDADQPFYGIQAIGLRGAAPKKRFTIEEMAGQYILEMREFQPEGPYYLGGSSLGGWVAYEMARQLTVAGQTVGLVAMFDTAVPGPLLTEGARSEWQKQMYRLSLHWNNVMALERGERLSYIREKASRIAERMGGRGRLPEAIQWVNEAGHWAASNHIPCEYSGTITLFRATEQPPWIVANRTLGWEKLVRGEIQIYDTPGHHADLVRDPRARVLAEQLNDALVKAQARFELRRSTHGQGNG
ncbi:MAG TPA: HAD-IIIC family phosphatase [Bryobacteraceae bacterium]|nr:HAD-IIIC family phosphatase [Bryobacteraceae bacterium]